MCIENFTFSSIDIFSEARSMIILINYLRVLFLSETVLKTASVFFIIIYYYLLSG